MSHQIAIVGSGPAGLYVAEVFAKLLPDVTIDVIDQLPTPYGLVRGGIAPDHQSTKNVIRQFERTLSRPGTRFLGNVEIGRDLTYEELKAAYDVVVLSIGAAVDRRLGIPGDDLPGVYGSAAIVGWYNGHPMHTDLAPLLDGTTLAVIGNGNVALDIVRVIAKTQAELAASDICSHADQALAAATLTDLYLIGRRGPVEASFTSKELGELGDLERCDVIVDPQQLPAEVGSHVPEKEVKVKQRNLEILREFSTRPHGERPLRLHVLFNAAPVAVLGEDRARALVLERTRLEQGRAIATGERFELPVQTVVSAIGYRTVPFPGVPFDESRGILANDEGLIEPGVYASGWCKHGPRGVVGTNRTDAQGLVARIIADLEHAPQPGTKPGGAGIDRLLRERGVRVVDYAAWGEIDRAEIARAQGSAKPREKFVRVDEMLEAAFALPSDERR
ncbi:ferredoxin-NADP reductase [bacterium]|nr:MAG: ferredoxin-NADP reductase [bacterium]